MSKLLRQLQNSIAYNLNAATYNPEAEAYAAEKEEVAKEEKAQLDQASVEKAIKRKKAKEAAAQKAAKEAAAEKKAREDAERNTFSVKRMLKRMMGITQSVLSTFLLIALGIFGASLATNLNVYKSFPYRILYLIYGFVFFFIVIPYALLWRWLYQKKRPRFYALFPIIGMHLDNPTTAALFSWLSFKPDADMELLNGCAKA
jgi:cation transport ATPase